MFEMKRNSCSVSFVFSSDMLLVDKAVKECGNCLTLLGMQASFRFKLVLRELLTNAVEHGNRMVFRRLVSCRIDCSDKNRFKIIVEDEGCGFDYESIDMKLPEDPLQVRNRGYALINAFSDCLRFNIAGNRITAYVCTDCDGD